MTSGEWWATVGGEVHLLQSPNGVRARCGLLLPTDAMAYDQPPAGELCQLCRLSYVADRAEIWFCEQRARQGTN